jgi:hypothetical protein
MAVLKNSKLDLWLMKLIMTRSLLSLLVEQEVYIEQLEGFVIHGKESHV